MEPRILVVEDSATQAEQLCFLLEAEGYDVTLARSGEEALERLGGEAFDLVLSDIVMPGIDGYELCRRVKAGHDVPVVLLTSLADPMDIVRGLEAGGDNYITKPYDPEQLLARLRRVLDNRQLRSGRRTSMGVNIAFLGSEFTISSDKEQILDLLLSSVEDIVRANHALEQRQRELAEAHAQLEASARESARAARLSDERARILMQNAGDAIFLLDGDGVVVEVNDGAAEMLGRSAEEILYRPLESFLDPDETAEALSGLRVTRGERTVLRDRVVQCADGSPVCVELSVSSTRLGDDDYLLVIARDVTERRRAEDELRLALSQLSEAQRLASLGNWEHDLRTDRVDWSAEGYRIFGLDPSVGAFTFERFLEHVHPDHRGQVRRARKAAVHDRAAISEEYRILRADGAERYVHVRGVAELDADGEPVRLHGTIQDVTERKQAEVALQESEERWRALVEHAADLIFILDEQGRIDYASPSVTRVLGYAPEELVGRDSLALVHPDDLGHVQEVLAATLEAPGELAEREFRYRHSDGSWRVIVARARNLIGHPAVRGIVVNSRDVTEQRRTEEQFRQAQKMEAVGRLAGGVAHDFNNLLTSIKGFAQLAADDLEPGSPVRQDLDEVIRGADRAARLTQQLLAFSRQQMLRPQVVSLNDVVEEMMRMLTRLVGEDVQVHTRLAGGLGEVVADPGQLQQVVMNLAVNARDAMPEGGTLTIETQNVELTEDYGRERLDVPPGPYVLLSVSDTGHGMSREVQERIFEPFFTTKEQGKGTGLGLSTVYGIVQQSNGFVQVYSEPGCGTTFKIYLPRADAASSGDPAAEAAAEPARELKGGGETILLVEDEAAVRTFARRVLARAGYTVLEAEDGADALRVLESYGDPVHLIVTDVVMPGMSGAALAEKAGKLRPGVRVLFTSGYAREEVAVRGNLPANVTFVEKPYTSAHLTQRVREVLSRPSAGPVVRA